MMNDTPESVTLVPIDRIEVLNSRDRNMKVFEEIVENIRAIGLKKPITVTEREGADGAPAYLLVCGEGRLNAFRLLGETHIPALVVNVTDEDAFIMSLAENIARRGHRPLEILADIELLLARDYSIDDIIQRTGLSEKYVRDIVFLLEKGEERLIEAVQNGTIPLTTALEIARAKHDDENLGDMLEEAYTRGRLMLAAVLALPGAYLLASSEAADVATSRYINTGIDAAGAAFRVGILGLSALYFFRFLRRKWQVTWPKDYSLASIGAIGMALAFLLVPISTVIGDRFGYYLIPIQTMIFARLPFLPFRHNAALHSALPYFGLLLVFTVWSQLSYHFQQCYLPYQTWIFGFPGGDPVGF